MEKVISPNDPKVNEPAIHPARTLAVNALSIDVEEHFHVHVFSKWIKKEDWEQQTSRVVENTRRLLALLRKYNVQATFFVLGWVAERQPDLVKEIADDGHEVASHGYSHQLVYEQTPEEFSEDLQRSLEVITRAVPEATISGYRAPSFSITEQTPWAQDLLASHGFQYDSSIFPVAMHDRYGVPDANRFAHRLDNGLWEFPMSTTRIAGRNLPVAGGGYFRLYPLWLTQKCMQSIQNEGYPAILYLHPWEVDPNQPRVEQATFRARFRHHVNIHKVESRLEMLLQRFNFAPITQVFSEQLANCNSEQSIQNNLETTSKYHTTAADKEYLEPEHAYRNRNPRGTLLSPTGARSALQQPR